jgi:hypothetical protein
MLRDGLTIAIENDGTRPNRRIAPGFLNVARYLQVYRSVAPSFEEAKK